MNGVAGVLLSGTAICCYEGALLGYILARFMRLRKAKKQAEEMSALQKEKVREEQLDQVLKNRLYQGSAIKALQNNIPYEVNFHEEAPQMGGTREGIAVQIVEKGKLSTRKYVIFISEVITIGQSNSNSLVLNDLSVATEQCRIFRHDGALYLQTLEDTHPVRLKRKREEMQLGKNAVRLMDQDQISVGDTTLQIHLL